MNNRLKSWTRSFLSLNKSEQRGIIILACLIIIINIGNLVLPYIVKPKIDPQFNENKKAVEEFLVVQKTLKDSIQFAQKQAKVEIIKSENLFKFDPNSISGMEMKKLGLSEKQVRNITNYRKKGGVFYRKSDLMKIYSLSAEEYQKLKPFIVIQNVQKKDAKYRMTQINLADSAIIAENLRFNSIIASRIVKYRKLLGGYYSTDQLMEVYKIKEHEILKAIPFITIDTSLIERLDINNITFKDLLKHPYFDYQTTKAIFDYRKKYISFMTLEQYKDSLSIPDSLFLKQKYYLYIRPHKIKIETK